MIKVKTFQINNKNSKLTLQEATAKEINLWQQDFPSSRIISIQSEVISGNGYRPPILVATVWYEVEQEYEQSYTEDLGTPTELASLLQNETLIVGIKK